MDRGTERETERDDSSVYAYGILHAPTRCDATRLRRRTDLRVLVGIYAFIATTCKCSHAHTHPRAETKEEEETTDTYLNFTYACVTDFPFPVLQHKNAQE